MRHYKKGRKLGTSSSHTKAMKKSLAVALFTNDRIKTTNTRAKEVRGLVDKIITWAKKGDLHSRRLAIAALGDAELVRETFEKAAQGMWKDRNGGYTRILKLGPRKGDNAPMVILELVNESATKKKDNKTVTKKTTKKSSAKDTAKKADSKDAAKGADKDGAADKGAAANKDGEHPDKAEEATGSKEADSDKAASDKDGEHPSDSEDKAADEGSKDEAAADEAAEDAADDAAADEAADK